MKKTVQRSDRAQRGMGPAVVQQLRSRLAGQPGGQTLLEFALVAPLLIFFILALVDFGIAIDRRLVLDHAVREGARYASVGATELTGDRDVEAVRDYAFAQAQEIPESADDFAVTYGCIVGEPTVEVRVSYVYNLVTPIGALANLAPGFSIPLNASASARVEQGLTGEAVPNCDG